MQNNYKIVVCKTNQLPKAIFTSAPNISAVIAKHKQSAYHNHNIRSITKLSKAAK